MGVELLVVGREVVVMRLLGGDNVGVGVRRWLGVVVVTMLMVVRGWLGMVRRSSNDGADS